MKSKKDVEQFQEIDAGFGFMSNSSYKLYCSRIYFEKCVSEQKECNSNFTKTSLTPTFIKLSASKNSFYNSIYSIKHLYEQNKKKIEWTCSKLEDELKRTDFLLETYSKIFVGTWSLLYIEYVMNKFLGFSLTYENYLEKVACFSDRYSTYTDVLSYYLSLTNVYKKLTDEYYCLLNTLHVFSSKASRKANEILSHLLDISSSLNQHETHLSVIAKESDEIGQCILKLQNSGFNFNSKIVKAKCYIDSLLQDMLSQSSDEIIKSEPFFNKINIIRNKIVLLKLLTKKVNV